MFSSLRQPLSAPVKQALLAVPSRGMAVNLSALKKRIKATANVAKLTGVMKMVASAKLKLVEERLAAGKPFGTSLKSSVVVPESVALGKDTKKKVLVVAVTSDRGLCGGVNSSVARYAREQLKDLKDQGHELTLVTIGDKARQQIARDVPQYVKRALDSCFDKDAIFRLAAAIGEKLVKEPFDVIAFLHNEYENAAKFSTKTTYVPRMSGYAVGILPPKLVGYDIEPENNEETLTNMSEFAVAGIVYNILLEQQACEVSQRIIAMDNASTNAGDMVARFTLYYNRARQSKITTELTEIVAGAESLVDESASI